MINLLPVLSYLSLVAGVTNARVGKDEACRNAPEPTVFPPPGPIVDSQNLSSEAFFGSPAKGTSLEPLFQFHPDASLMHTDGGNSGGRNDAGPLGINPSVRSAASRVNMMVWGGDGSLIGGYANTTSGSPRLGIVALDPNTFQILAAWYPPNNETLGPAYMEYIKKTEDIVISTKEGHIYVVHRGTCDGTPFFTTSREIAMSSELKPGQMLLNAMYDVVGNIWFSTGGLINGGDVPSTSLTYGYITPRGKVVKNNAQNELMENGIAVDGLNVYMVTGPVGTGNSTESTGHMYSITSDWRDGIKINWRVPYTGRSAKDTGDVARGAGSSPSLLADKYVAITDRASPQINMNIYHRDAQSSDEKQLLCQVPLFTPGKSDNDNAILGHFDGETSGFIVQNDYDIPALFKPKLGEQVDMDGPWNDMSKMEGGIARVDVDAEENCSLRWSTPHMAIKSVSILSTKTGLIYTYIQDTERAAKGEYVWYLAPVDWNTGEIVYKARVGSGGIFNDNYLQGSVGPDGSFYQTVMGGIVAVKDGNSLHL